MPRGLIEFPSRWISRLFFNPVFSFLLFFPYSRTCFDGVELVNKGDNFYMVF